MRSSAMAKPVKVKIVFEPMSLSSRDGKEIVEHLAKSGIYCTLTTTCSTFVISVHTRSNLIVSLAGHLELMKVLSALNELKYLQGKMKIISVSTYDMNRYDERGAKVK